MWTATLAALLLGLPLAQEPAPLGPPTATTCRAVADQTGIEWTFPFSSALERAKREGRILMVKPIAFGTTRDGGW